MDRIDFLASLAKDSNILVDVGCDHGYSLIKAIKYYNVKNAIAIDINEGPLNNCKKNALKYGLNDKFKFILSDGFLELNEEFDTAIISGMGGILIKDILEKSLDKIKNHKLIIEANSDSYLVRKYLVNNDFIITDEYAIVDENKYYEIMVFEPGNLEYVSFELKYGPILLNKKEDVFVNEYKKRLKSLEEYLPNIKDTILKDEKYVLRNDYLKVIHGDNTKMYPIPNTDNYYRCYFHDDKRLPLIIISAGGGYKYTSPRESEPVQKFYFDNGYNVIIVNYRESLDYYPVPQESLAYVIKKYQNDRRVSKIIGLGFSAGGHNILEVALHQDLYNCKIDLLMLGYPVVTANPLYWHKGSFDNLVGNNDKLLKRLSLEYEVNENAPDLFLWGTLTDESVPVENSLLLVEAYKKYNLSVEYHLFPIGGHGLSLANETTSLGDKKKELPIVSQWKELSLNWLKLKINE